MKTKSFPSRTWTHSAGRAIQVEDSPFAGGRVMGERLGALGVLPIFDSREGNLSRFSKGSGSMPYSTSSGFVHGSDSSGRRNPTGESPGIRKRRSEATNQG